MLPRPSETTAAEATAVGQSENLNILPGGYIAGLLHRENQSMSEHMTIGTDDEGGKTFHVLDYKRGEFLATYTDAGYLVMDAGVGPAWIAEEPGYSVRLTAAETFAFAEWIREVVLT